MNQDIPYLSTVLFSRNDDHGSNMFLRMQLCIGTLISQMEKYQIPSELILVEWNPPENKPLLKDVFPWPKVLNYCKIKVIIVPQEIHNRYEHSDLFPMHTKIAPNVGIRRARGRFVLSTSVDCLLSDELVKFINNYTSIK